MIVLGGTLCGLMGLGGFALRASLAVAAPRASVRIGAAPRTPAGAKVVGSVSGGTKINVTVVLNSQDPAGLAAYATDVATPGSSVYHQYLTVPQFAQRFGATTAQVRAVKSALRAEGLDPGRVTTNDLSIPVSATAGQLATAFSTSFHSVRLRGGRKTFANTSAPLLPGTVADLVQGVIGLDNLALEQPLGLASKRLHVTAHATRDATPHANPHIGSGPQPCAGIEPYGQPPYTYRTEDEIASAYGMTSLYPGDEGAGQVVAVYELEPNLTSDITSFQTCYGTNTTVNYVPVDGGVATGAGEGEAALDIEDVIGLAPKATLDVYQAPNTGADAYDEYNAIISQDKAKVITTSWGLCEASKTLGTSTSKQALEESTLFQEAATQGQSMFAAAGDHGSVDCGGTSPLAVDDPASQPYVTGVGGTVLSTIGPPPTESVWNDYSTSTPPSTQDNEDAGGGVSSFWAMPSYQSGAPAPLNVINSGSSKTACAANLATTGGTAGSYCREVPDVTADASPETGYIIQYNGQWDAFGGTSAATPTWAAFATLVNASPACDGVPIGFANPLLYSIAGGAFNGTAYSADFNDVTMGNNNPMNYLSPGNEGPYSAGLGYDMASGLGSGAGATLASALCATIGTVTMPNTGSLPTAVAVDTTNNIAYIAESMTNDVAQITQATHSAFATNAATNVASAKLLGLNFPDDLALDSSENLYASNFCVGTQAGICSGEASGTTTALSQQKGASGQQDTLTPCKYASGDAVFTPATGNAMLFVACAGSGAVDACTTTGSTPLCGSANATVTLGKPVGGVTPVPSGVAAIPTETATPAVIVADAANSTLSVVSYSSASLSASTPVSLAAGCRPANVAIGPSVSGTATVYVACPGTGEIEVGTLSGTVLGSFTATALPTSGSQTPAPYGIALNQSGTALVVTDSANSDAVLYLSLSGSTLGSDTVVSVGTTPDGVAMDGNNAFVANESTNTVTVIDPPSSGGDHGHLVASHMRSDAARRAPVSLTPLIAPLPAGASG